ncbi:AimR family lysis-lysogeny pheromone receptor [Bacillus sp. XF8]|uniref:AimR family lysis-lysogeny pheromone receptor n=1 Tax=Bacillus sp. XF8 TaxID=2819289 RepID=UPI001AA08711|nr:AimR family lysis-lysogeny pheromone receptor [Bacillus sp. XF8]MBO1583002.1 AimR family lysis-lysogeny pheromone receptor [Bacillus sp. XF8]
MHDALKAQKEEKNALLKKQKDKTLKKLLSKIDTELAAKKITYTQLSKCWGISVSGVSNVFSGEREISFCYLAKTLVLLYEDHLLRRELLEEYLKVAKPENLREALEYLALRGEFDLVKMLINKEYNSDTPENREWCRVYELICQKAQKKKIKKETLMNYYDSLEEEMENNSNFEMKILIDILLCHTSYQLGDYRLLNKRLNKLMNKASRIKNKFVKKCYKVRIEEGLAAIYLTSDQLDEVRDRCNILLELCENEPHLILNKARALWLKAESFIFDDYEQSLKLFNESLEILEDNVNPEMEKKKNAIIKTIQFLKIYHNRDLNTLGVMDDGERAFFEIRIGNLEAAIEILSNIEIKNRGLSSFELVYLGMAQKNREIIKQGLRKFEEKSSLFYARFPKKELGLI